MNFLSLLFAIDGKTPKMGLKRKRSPSTDMNEKQTSPVEHKRISEEITLRDYEISDGALQETNSVEYHIAKLLDLNIILLVCDEDTWASNERNLNIVRHNGREHLAAIFDSGDYIAMKSTKQKLVSYEQKLTQYNNNRYTSQGVQTECGSSGTDTGEAPKTEYTYTILQTAFDILLGVNKEPTHERDKSVDELGFTTLPPTENCRDVECCQFSSPSPKPLDCEQLLTDTALQTESRDESAPCGSVAVTKRYKKNWCHYCETMQTKLVRHMIAKHSKSPEVQQYILATDPNPALQKLKRQEICRHIVNRSNYQYNKEVIAAGATEKVIPIKVNRKQKVSVMSHVICSTCKGLVNKRYFSCHSKNCKLILRQDPNDIVARRAVPKGSFLLPPLEPKYKPLEKQIFPMMKKDKISYIAQTDHLILQYGINFLQTHKSYHQRYYVSYQLRALANLLICLKNVDPVHVKTLTDCLDPTNFNNLCKVVREWSGYDDISGLCSRPSVPSRLGKILKACSNITLFEAINNKHLTTEQQLEVRTKHERFMALMKSDWAMEVKGVADKSLINKRKGKEQKIPLLEDIKKVSKQWPKK